MPPILPKQPQLIKQVAQYLNTGATIADPTHTEKLDVMLEHFDEVLAYYGKTTGVMMARKHLGWYSAGLKNSGEFRAKVNRLNDPEEIVSVIKNFWS